MFNSNNNRALKTKLVVFCATIIYLIITALLEGVKTEHWILVLLYNSLIWINPKTRKFILAFSIFAVFGIIYDLMRVYPNYMVNPVDVAHIYHFEKSIFGITTGGKIVTLSEYCALHHNIIFDFISGLAYINWMPVPLAFGIWLYAKNKEQFLHFSFAFLLVNLLGFTIYYIHPAAPPWYVAKYGFDLHMGIGGDIAGLARFDQLMHAKLFGSIYSRNSNVFAAIPSLHSAYPIVVLFYAIKNNVKWVKWLLVLFMFSIWFTAVYSGHHYVTDVILGIMCAVIGLFIYEKILLNISFFRKFIARYVCEIK